jgi:tetratricopeptide (TPR) repeat protein
MTDGHCFISYSTADAKEFARRLADELQGGEDIFIKTWFDKRDIDPARDWDDQIVDGIRSCKCMLFVMTKDSTAPGSMCKNEWNWALKYKKPVVPIRLQNNAEQPFGLGNRQWIDFTGEFDHGLSKLRIFLREMDSPKGILQSLKDRHADAERDLRRAKPEDQPRILAEIEELNKQIEIQQKIVDNPKAAEKRTEENIQSGLERERQPDKPAVPKTTTKFINPPPGIAPTYFQDRFIETKQIVDFLKNDTQRLMTIVGRAGIGKTAMICRLLKTIESGQLPDGLGEMKADGIVYLSETGTHRVNFANIFADLNKLLPSEISAKLEGLYKDPQTSTGDKMRALLDSFPQGRVVLLMDNFENLIDSENLYIRDNELSDALKALLSAPQHVVKVVLTTRVAPRDLAMIEPGRQYHMNLDEGLESPYAENVLREMDSDGRVGLKNASDELLGKAREKTRGYPRALEALYAILSVDRYTTLKELLALDLPKEVVEKLVGEAFNRLDPTAQKVMQALAVYNRPVSPAAIDYSLQPYLASIDSALVLNRLVNMHFARREAGKYYLHPADREYAFGIIPEGEKTLEEIEKPDFKFAETDSEEQLENTEETVKNDAEEEISDVNIDDIDFESLLRNYKKSRTDFTRYGLLDRAADYFAQARKPRAEWKKLDDLTAQLAEFELRCEAGDYDTATSVLLEINFDYLFQWGHHRLMIEMHNKLQGKIIDMTLARISTGNLGSAYSQIGKIQEAIQHTKQAIEMARNAKNRQAEGTWLGNLGIYYFKLGDTHKAIGYHEQALVIDHESGYHRGESEDYCNAGLVLIDLGDHKKATIYFSEAIKIADEIAYPTVQIEARWGFAQTYLFQNDLVYARATIEVALQCDAPQYNHNATALHGIIALRQGERETAQEAFAKSIAQADEILARTPEYYDALDAKGLALGGLALCARDDGQLTIDRGKTIAEAVETFRKARKIAPHAGVVKSVLRLFDELVKCDEEGILKDVRRAVEGQ